MPCRKHLSNTLLKSKYIDVKTQTDKKFKMVNSVCVTLDIWSNRKMRSYIGITGHFILELSLESVMLACTRFKGKHSTDNIIQEYI